MAKHGVGFAAIREADFSSIVSFEDARKNYGEKRVVLHILIRGRLHVMVYTWRKDVRRIISLRKANNRERVYYEKELN